MVRDEPPIRSADIIDLYFTYKLISVIFYIMLYMALILVHKNCE